VVIAVIARSSTSQHFKRQKAREEPVLVPQTTSFVSLAIAGMPLDVAL